jgi:hypothetical protein
MVFIINKEDWYKYIDYDDYCEVFLDYVRDGSGTRSGRLIYGDENNNSNGNGCGNGYGIGDGDGFGND